MSVADEVAGTEHHLADEVAGTEHHLADEVAGTEHHFAEVVRGPVVLWEGSILPSAHLERLVAAYDVVATYHEPTAHLVIAGPADPIAAERARRYAIELALPHAWIAADVSAPVLDVMRRHATVRLRSDVPDVAPTVLAEHLLARIAAAHMSQATAR
jgi:hypothetical protein